MSYCISGEDEDESFCRHWNCSKGRWKCGNNKCIKNESVCDGRDNCRDSTEELPELCRNWTCHHDFIKCQDNVKCIPKWKIMNGVSGCNDGSDEDPQYHIRSNCSEQSEHLCDDGVQCISGEKWCDGKSYDDLGFYEYYNCRDLSDEGDHCKDWECLPDRWKCEDNLQCIEATKVCDGKLHCNDGSDELYKLCGCLQASDWICQNEQGCVSIEEVCDGKDDCKDKSDEDRNMCLNLSCINGSTKCADEIQCISKFHICDGSENCKDGSDELCTDLCLRKPLEGKSIIRKCPEDSSVCVPVERYCDRVADCPDGGDESKCSCEDWNMHEFRLEGINMCIYKRWIHNESMVSMCEEISCDVVYEQQWQLLKYQG